MDSAVTTLAGSPLGAGTARGLLLWPLLPHLRCRRPLTAGRTCWAVWPSVIAKQLLGGQHIVSRGRGGRSLCALRCRAVQRCITPGHALEMSAFRHQRARHAVLDPPGVLPTPHLEPLPNNKQVAVSCENITLSGGMVRQKAKYERFLNKRSVSNPGTAGIPGCGASTPPRRTVRGMVPHKAAAAARWPPEGVEHPCSKVQARGDPPTRSRSCACSSHRNVALGDIALPSAGSTRRP